MLCGAVLNQAVLVEVLAAAVRAGEGEAIWHWTAGQKCESVNHQLQAIAIHTFGVKVRLISGHGGRAK